ncbi:receptor-like protein EIX2 [Oryza glaberrima]|uniref:receptor-like protein EIX2 n=1 Tax=Oryza glaberrima TaxID=4538 RepID=UPI00023DEC9E|nr:receptor-like protein EIX2 [Oryza glaberrima]
MAPLKLLVLLAPLFLQSSSTTTAVPPPSWGSHRCITGERDALLSFKAGITDPGHYLSSWQGEDCCQWKGVRCSNRTSHVVELRLNSLHEVRTSIGFGGGELNSTLLTLPHLMHLDLRVNDFNGARIPEFIGGLNNLLYLYLYGANFSGLVPPNLGNLSKLIHLDLNSMSNYGSVYSTDLAWLSRLTKLQYVDISGVNLSTAVNWVHVVNKLSSLVTLNLRFCELQNVIPSPLNANLTLLEQLDLYGNKFSSSLGAKNLFWDLPNLRYFDMGVSGLQGSIPDEVGNMTSIIMLHLHDNKLTGTIPATFRNLCKLEELWLSTNNINGPVAVLFERLPARKNLQELLLYENNLTGSLLDQLGHLSNLTTLDISNNMLSGEIPTGISALTMLTELLLSFNSLEGTITESHFVNLTALNHLDLCDNSLTMVFQQGWVPPFKLDIVDLRSCMLGSDFPEWLRSQNSVYVLDISNTGITDSLPHWFWITFSKTQHLVLSNNQISGMLPPRMFRRMEAETMDFSNNILVGPMPELPRNLWSLDLSRNNLSGPLSSYLGAPLLTVLIIFENSLSGKIPNSFCRWKKLEFLDLSGNLLRGTLPNCGVQSNTGKLPYNNSSRVNQLKVLNLNGNNLFGEFPLFLQKCQNLLLLNLGHNQFYGNLPTWIGEKLPTLAFLSLRSNFFSGHIPPQIANLTELQYLDIACNNMSGSIPESFKKLRGMTLSPADNDSLSYYGSNSEGIDEIDLDVFPNTLPVITKGQQLEYLTGIMYMVNFDLSCNSLTGQVPAEISKLVALKSLNLSYNLLSGIIPNSIGGLHALESLDLSDNEFSGEIPASLSFLTSLSHLNLSYNNLTGKVPSGYQLQTLDDQPSIYIGNPGLCGPPLSKSCSETNASPADTMEHDNGSDGGFFLLAVSSGYVTGLWTIFCAILFKKEWRVVCFSFSDFLFDWIYVRVVMCWASLARKRRAVTLSGSI